MTRVMQTAQRAGPLPASTDNFGRLANLATFLPLRLLSVAVAYTVGCLNLRYILRRRRPLPARHPTSRFARAFRATLHRSTLERSFGLLRLLVSSIFTLRQCYKHLRSNACRHFFVIVSNNCNKASETPSPVKLSRPTAAHHQHHLVEHCLTYHDITRLHALAHPPISTYIHTHHAGHHALEHDMDAPPQAQ